MDKGHEVEILYDCQEMTAGLSFYDKKEYCEMRKHDYVELYYIAAGDGELKLGDRIQDIKTGQFIIIIENTPHDIRCSSGAEEVKVFWIQIKKERG